MPLLTLCDMTCVAIVNKYVIKTLVVLNCDSATNVFDL